MNVLKFPTREERSKSELRKHFEDITDIFDGHIRTELIDDLVLYVKRFAAVENTTISLACEKFTAEQSKAIQEAFDKIFSERESTVTAMMEVIVDLRFKKAICQMLHGDQ